MHARTLNLAFITPVDVSQNRFTRNGEWRRGGLQIHVTTSKFHKVLGVDDWVWHTETIYSSPQDPPPTTLSAKAVTDYVWENEEAIVLYQLTDNDGNTRTSGTSVPTFNGFTCGSRETYSGVGYCSSRISQSQNYTISYGSSTENVFIEVKPTPTWAQSNWIFDKYTSLWTAGGFTVPVSDTVYFSMKLPFNDVRITSGTTATMNVEIYLIQSTSTFDYDGGEFELYWPSSCTRGVTTVNNVFAFNFKANHEYLRSVIRTGSVSQSVVLVENVTFVCPAGEQQFTLRTAALALNGVQCPNTNPGVCPDIPVHVNAGRGDHFNETVYVNVVDATNVGIEQYGYFSTGRSSTVTKRVGNFLHH